MNNKPAIKQPKTIRELIIQAFARLMATRKDLEIQEYKCTAVGRWLEFRVVLRGNHSFPMFVGASKKVLNYCRRMCRANRSFVQGITISVDQSIEEIERRIINCIISVRTALSWGNRAVVSRSNSNKTNPEGHEGSIVMNYSVPPTDEKPRIHSGMPGATFMLAHA